MVDTLDWLLGQLVLFRTPSIIALCLVAVIICLHVCLPQHHRYTRTIRLAHPPSQVWHTITAVENYPSWRSHIVFVQPLDKSTFVEHVARTRHFAAQKQLTAPPPLGTRARRIDMKRIGNDTLVRRDRAIRAPLLPSHAQHALDVAPSSFEREWHIHIQPNGPGSLLTLTETVRSEGVLARWLGPVFGFHRMSQRFLVELSRELDRQRKQSTHEATLCESPLNTPPPPPLVDPSQRSRAAA